MSSFEAKQLGSFVCNFIKKGKCANMFPRLFSLFKNSVIPIIQKQNWLWSRATEYYNQLMWKNKTRVAAKLLNEVSMTSGKNWSNAEIHMPWDKQSL